jgi:hypothetical protein
MRRGEIGRDHHVAAPVLFRFAKEASWREEQTRDSDGSQTDRTVALAMAWAAAQKLQYSAEKHYPTRRPNNAPYHSLAKADDAPNTSCALRDADIDLKN